MKFQEAFEQAVPELIAAAWDYTDRSDKIDLIWVYVSKDGHWAFSHTYYYADGQYLNRVELKNVIPDLDVSSDAQRWMQGRLREASNGIIESMDNPDEFPRRMILRFRPSDQDFNADFFYGDLQPGVKQEDELLEHELAFQWFARLKATGNDSASV